MSPDMHSSRRGRGAKAGALAIAAGCALALGLLAPGSKPPAGRG